MHALTILRVSGLPNLTFIYFSDKFGFINDIVWASLDTDGKSWKQIFKSLTLVEFLIKNGSERFIESARDKLFKIKRLQDYNYYEGTVDKGSGCREKAKQIVELLASNETIRAEREKARSLRNKFGGVGSDSASSGGHYGGSYGGSSDSYSNQGSDSRDRDRDSRGGGGGGGRYGGDSYNDRSYSDRGDNRSNTTTNNTGRYGGGAYNSDKPPRYGDDAPTSNNDVDDVHIKPYKAKEADRSNTSTGGKLKVSIRKSVAEPAPTIAAAPAPQEVNLMGDDFDAFSSTPAPAQRAADDFDPFISAPAAAQAPTAPAAAAFDPFGMSAPAPAPAQAAPAFDPFMSAPAPAAAPAFDPFGQQQAHFGQPQPAYNAAPLQPQQQYGQFSTTPAAHYQQQAPQPPVQQQQQQQFRANPAPAAPVFQQQQQQQQQSADADFGDFEAAKPAAAPKAPAANKWGDLGSLVDLGGIAKNQAPAPKNDAAATAVNASYANSSFAGLDGFSKTPQNMVIIVNTNFEQNNILIHAFIHVWRFCSGEQRWQTSGIWRCAGWCCDGSQTHGWSSRDAHGQ